MDKVEIQIFESLFKRKELSSQLKLVGGIVHALSMQKGHCWASNAQLAEILNVTENAIGDAVRKLVKMKIIVNDGNKHDRKLRLTFDNNKNDLYIHLPRFILTSTILSPTEKIVCSLILSLSKKKGHCFSGYYKLSENSGQDIKTVKRMITKLIRNNLLQNKGDKNRLELVLNEELLMENSKLSKQEILDSKQENLNINNEKNDIASINILKNKKYISCAQEVQDNGLFDKFWNIYPRKDNRHAALKKFNLLSAQKQKEIIALTRYFADEMKDRAQEYILMATNYLKQERYLDYEQEETTFKILEPKNKTEA